MVWHAYRGMREGPWYGMWQAASLADSYVDRAVTESWTGIQPSRQTMISSKSRWQLQWVHLELSGQAGSPCDVSTDVRETPCLLSAIKRLSVAIRRFNSPPLCHILLLRRSGPSHPVLILSFIHHTFTVPFQVQNSPVPQVFSTIVC